MKKLPINTIGNHPENQIQLPKTEEHIAPATHRLMTLVNSPDSSTVAIAKADLERVAGPEHSRWELRNPTLRHAQCDKSDFRNCDDFSDMEQVEYSERPYLSDEKWFV